MRKKNNLTTKYHNDLNTLPFRNFDVRELDLFFTIISKIKNEGGSDVTYNFDDLKELSNYSDRDISRFTKDLEDTYSKIMDIPFRIENEKIIARFHMFRSFIIDKKNQTIKISVDDHFRYFLNDFDEQFTYFQLEEFTEINTTYGKSLYRLLKQYKSQGWYQVSVLEFRNLFGIPTGYRMSNIDQRILNPSITELEPYFKNLKVEKIKSKKGRTIEFLNFTFEKEISGKSFDKNKYKKKSFEKTEIKKNQKNIQPEYSNYDEADDPEEIKSLLQKIKKR